MSKKIEITFANLAVETVPVRVGGSPDQGWPITYIWRGTPGGTIPT